MVTGSSWALATSRRPASRLVLVVAVAMLGGCQQSRQPGPEPDTSRSALVATNGLGRNGLGRNGLGRNGLGRNGLGRNGLGRNGLGRNGASAWLIDGSVNTDFVAWFEESPAENGYAMGYFVRCAYDVATEIQYTDASGTAWAWTGQYGLAMPSLLSEQMMSEDELKWVSACLLAHVNLTGSHQYISVRGNPPNLEAQAALHPSENERWLMSFPAGIYFGDLFADEPTLYASPQLPTDLGWYGGKLVLGRDCDFVPCFWDPEGHDHVLTFQYWKHPDFLQGRGELVGTQTDPDYPYDQLKLETWAAGETTTYRPVFVNGPWLADFEREGEQVLQAARIERTGLPVAPEQVVACPPDQCIDHAKLVGLVSGQAVRVTSSPYIDHDSGPVVVDMGAPATALIRYSNGKLPRLRPADVNGTTVMKLSGQRASALVTIPTREGGWLELGSELFPFTGGQDVYTYLQVYPVFPQEDVTFGRPAVKVTVAGATEGEDCTGALTKRGSSWAGTCAPGGVTKRCGPATKGAECSASDQVGAPCRGSLICQGRSNTWMWSCVGSGAALYQCTPGDAPDLDMVAFIPGAPSCMPAGASRFAGVCP